MFVYKSDVKLTNKEMKIRKYLIGGMLLCLPVWGWAQEVVKQTMHRLTSPDGAYEFCFYQKQFPEKGKQMFYTLKYRGKTVVEESELGVDIENRLFECALGVPHDTASFWGSNLEYAGQELASKDTLWHPVYGERAGVRDCYREMILKFRKGDAVGEVTEGYDKRRGYLMNVEVRAYNEGVAFRYHFPLATNGLFLHITDERTAFTMPAGTMAYYERWAQGPYALLPLESWEDECERPLVLKLTNGLTVALAEARLVDFVRTKFRLDSVRKNTLRTSLYSSADVTPPYGTPWRVIMAAERDADLANHNDILLNLNDPCRLADAGWIRPGKVFRSQLSQREACESVDFAADRGLQYVHLDAGWYGPEGNPASDAQTVAKNRDLDIPALCRYAASKGLGVLLYVNQRALTRQLDSILPLYRSWGVAGIKFGFVHVGNQRWTTWLHGAVRKCAEHQMLVDIHDEYRPTGYSRTYPNLMTQEGIRGNEEMPDATHNVTLPFTRFLAGAGDYTLCYFNPRIKCTHAHQLAMAVVYYSPLQFMFWYDKPADYRGEPELEFWKQVKTVWDDSRVLEGEIGQYVVTARRSGEEWFLGAMTNTEARDLKVKTDFLVKGKKYRMTLYEDDPQLDTRTKVKITTRRVKGGDTLSLHLQPSGGAAVHFTEL